MNAELSCSLLMLLVHLQQKAVHFSRGCDLPLFCGCACPSIFLFCLTEGRQFPSFALCLTAITVLTLFLSLRRSSLSGKSACHYETGAYRQCTRVNPRLRSGCYGNLILFAKHGQPWSRRACGWTWSTVVQTCLWVDMVNRGPDMPVGGHGQPWSRHACGWTWSTVVQTCLWVDMVNRGPDMPVVDMVNRGPDMPVGGLGQPWSRHACGWTWSTVVQTCLWVDMVNRGPDMPVGGHGQPWSRHACGWDLSS